MKRIIASLLIAAGTTVSMLSAQPASADPYYSNSRSPSIIVVPNEGQYDNDRYDNGYGNDRRYEGRRNDRDYRSNRHGDYGYSKHSRNRIWVPGHFERVGYGYHGRRWVAGHWEYRR